MSNVILVVDDCEVMRGLICAVLQSEGLRTETARDGGEALLRAEGLRPALVMLDLHMPGLDGLEVLRALKRHPATRDIPVLVLTAEDDDARLIAAHAAGAVGYLHKPFAADRLAARVSEVLADVGLRWVDDEHRVIAA